MLVDPPWSYNRKKTGGTGKSASNQHYDTLSVQELKNLQIENILNENSMLFLWTTNSFIRDAFDIMEIWGFNYKTMITWVKRNNGLGNYFRGKTEHMLFGTRGKMKPLYIQKPNVIYTKEGEKLKHSQKPIDSIGLVQACTYQMIDKLDYKEVNVLEMFARDGAEKDPYYDMINWYRIGKEINGNDIRKDLEMLRKK